MTIVVTIGICARNCENTLNKAIGSIMNQDFPHEKMQVIVVDDGSDDHTFQIINSYAKRMDIATKVFQTKWRGLGPVRNIIANNACGRYILWVDADEVLPSSYVRRQIEFMEENPDVGVTAGIVGLVPGNLVLNLELIPGIISHINFELPNSFLWKTAKVIGTGGATFRIEALRQVGGFDEKLTGAGEDADLVRRIKEAGWLVKLNDAQFLELHNGMYNYKDLWRKYVWYGLSSEQFHREGRKLFSFPRMSPMAGLITGILYSMMGYRLIKQKRVFLLPIHFGIKMTAWSFGFLKGQLGLH